MTSPLSPPIIAQHEHAPADTAREYRHDAAAETGDGAASIFSRWSRPSPMPFRAVEALLRRRRSRVTHSPAHVMPESKRLLLGLASRR